MQCLAAKRLLFVIYKSQKRTAKYSQFFAMPEAAIRELQRLAQYCAHAHSVPNLFCEVYIDPAWGVILVSHNVYHISLMLALEFTDNRDNASAL